MALWEIVTYEETVRIPLLFRHEGRIAPGSTFPHRTCNYDFFPSLLGYLGMTDQLPHFPELPGRSYAAALTGEPCGDWDGAVFHEYENARMVRADRWKYTWRCPEGPDELYDMVVDPGERTNLAASSDCAATVGEMRERIDAFFNRYADPQYDRWRGGRSKAGGLADVWSEEGKR